MENEKSYVKIVPSELLRKVEAIVYRLPRGDCGEHIVVVADDFGEVVTIGVTKTGIMEKRPDGWSRHKCFGLARIKYNDDFSTVLVVEEPIMTVYQNFADCDVHKEFSAPYIYSSVIQDIAQKLSDDPEISVPVRYIHRLVRGTE